MINFVLKAVVSISKSHTVKAASVVKTVVDLGKVSRLTLGNGEYGLESNTRPKYRDV